MTSSNGNIFYVTGLLCGEFTGHRLIPPNKGHWRGALRFSLICARINGWVNNGEAGDLRHHVAHYDSIVMVTDWRGRTLKHMYMPLICWRLDDFSITRQVAFYCTAFTSTAIIIASPIMPSNKQSIMLMWCRFVYDGDCWSNPFLTNCCPAVILINIHGHAFGILLYTFFAHAFRPTFATRMKIVPHHARLCIHFTWSADQC